MILDVSGYKDKQSGEVIEFVMCMDCGRGQIPNTKEAKDEHDKICPPAIS